MGFSKLVLFRDQSIENAANPYFFKTRKARVSSSKNNNKEWFDSECANAKHHYLVALNTFNKNKTRSNRIELSEIKLSYKFTCTEKEKDL